MSFRPSSPCGFRRGFTLVELLVVIAIIGILVALLLPAVQAARESARRIQCTNQIKQLGLAIVNYEAARKEYPAGSYSYDNWGLANLDRIPMVDCTVTTNGGYDCDGTNWMIEILPYVEQQPLYDRYDQQEENVADTDLNGNGLINAEVLRTEVKEFKCPTDLFANEADGGYARGSYKGVSGILMPWSGSSWLNFSSPPDMSSNPTVDYFKSGPWGCRGIFHTSGYPGMPPEKAKNVTDGTTKTYVIGESHNIGSNPNPIYWGVSWRFVNKSDLLADPLLRQTDRQFCIDNITGKPTWLCNRQFATGHAGDGGNWLRLDGSVAFVTASIDGLVYESFATIAADDEFEPADCRP